MARTTTSATRSNLYAPATTACYLVLLDVTSTELTNPIYVVNNNEDVTHNSQVYSALGFQFSLPAEKDSEVASSQITIDNVDRNFATAIRSVRNPLNITARIIEASDPDTVEVGPFDFQLRAVKYTASTITGQMYYMNYVEKNAGIHQFSNLIFPGLYV